MKSLKNRNAAWIAVILAFLTAYIFFQFFYPIT